VGLFANKITGIPASSEKKKGKKPSRLTGQEVINILCEALE
jgi:hypothetical protein